MKELTFDNILRLANHLDALGYETDVYLNKIYLGNNSIIECGDRFEVTTLNVIVSPKNKPNKKVIY